MAALRLRPVLMASALAAMLGCQTTAPIRTAEYVDLERFMGDWYVLASIPTRIERNAFNAVESYRMSDDGTIATTFSFNEGGFDGEAKTYNPTGFVRDNESNAIWGMQFIWPIKAEYLVMHVDPDYEQTIIGRSKRDYVWIMARTPSIPTEQYERHVAFLAEQGYDVTQLRQVPHRWN